ARRASWGEDERAAARAILDRIAAERRARAVREVRARLRSGEGALLHDALESFGATMPLGEPMTEMVTLHCPIETVHALATFLREHGAETVSVASLDYVFARDNGLYAKLAAGLEGH